MLLNWRDLQCISYLLVAPGLAYWQWLHGFSWLLYSLMMVIWIGIGVINHHHAHRPIWNNDVLNRFTSILGTALQGHPVYVFEIAHNNDHHFHNHGPGDIARTYQFGDHNHLLGHVLHPAQVLFVLYPFFFDQIRRVKNEDRSRFNWICVEYAVVLGLWVFLLALAPIKTLQFVLVPQIVCLHWLLGTNYLQHAHANGLSQWDFARNFCGAINWVYFNIGYHTAHHYRSESHWSEMPVLHRQIVSQINPQLIQASFFRYYFRTYILSIFYPSLRSRSLMPESSVQ